MTPNQKLSEALAVLATIDPASQAASTVSTGWLDTKQYLALLAIVDVGVFGASATVDANIQQATDGTGTGAKLVTGKSITQLLAAGGNNRQVEINIKPDELDVANSFEWIRLNVVVGTAATQTSAIVLGGFPRYADAGGLFNQVGVAQIL
jgi:hypothetical protein